MKVCPECGTQYEDHVPTCIADGATLVAQVAAPVSIPPEKARSTLPPARPSSRLPFVLLGLVLFGVVAAVSVLALAVASSQLAIGRPPAPEVAQVRLPPPRPEPEPVPEPPERPPVEVVLASEPLGAKVFENDQFVCVTPCTIQHPPHAPLPREFVFKADGHRDVVYEMTEAKGPIAVALPRLRSSPVPSASSNAAPRPTIGRDR